MSMNATGGKYKRHGGFIINTFFSRYRYMKHHYFKGVILKAGLLRNTENIVINCSNTSPFAFWTRLIFVTVILGGRFV